MQPDLVECGNDLRHRQRVADARSGHPMRLRERARPDHTWIAHIHGQQRILRREVAIRLVEQEQAIFRQRLYKGADLLRSDPRSAGIIRVRQIDDARLRTICRFGQPSQIVAVVTIGNTL